MTEIAETMPAVAYRSSLSIDDLANLEITSVSRQPEPLSGAPAAVYVITADDIRRAGAVSLAEAPNVPRHLVDLPRLAMFTTWGSTQEVGWVRHAFDHFEVPYDLIYKERIRKGNLHDAYDVILVPSQGRGGGKSLVFDVELLDVK